MKDIGAWRRSVSELAVNAQEIMTALSEYMDEEELKPPERTPRKLREIRIKIIDGCRKLRISAGVGWMLPLLNYVQWNKPSPSQWFHDLHDSIVDGERNILGTEHRAGLWNRLNRLGVELNDIGCRFAAEISPDPQNEQPQQASMKSRNEQRDKWIYDQCCKGMPHDKIVAELKRVFEKKKWSVVRSKQRIQQIGLEYAKKHGLPSPPSRR